MPQGDRTGPLGLGSGTGSTFGYCYGYDAPGSTGGQGRGMGRAAGFGRGFGRRRGLGRGWGFTPNNLGNIPGHQWMPSVSNEDEIKMLKSEAEALKRSQKEIEKRLGELEKGE